MTEFLVFLAICALFSLLFWLFLRSARKWREEQRIAEREARVTKKIADLTDEFDSMIRQAQEYKKKNEEKPY